MAETASLPRSMNAGAPGVPEPVAAAPFARERRMTWQRRLDAPIDIASLVYFRAGFGLIMAWWAWSYLASGRVRAFYVVPKFHFTYYGFDWVRPWPGVGMSLHFAALMPLALCIARVLRHRFPFVL